MPGTTSASRTVETLRDQIVSGTLEPGARLGEAEIAKRLRVSRTPVREALRQLAAEGLVEHIPNRGARVVGWTIREIEDVFALRLTLEPELTALACGHAGSDDVDGLDDLALSMQRLGDPGPDQDLEQAESLNREFHGRLIELADAPMHAAAVSGALRGSMRSRTYRVYSSAALRRSLAHHLEIVAALRAGDAVWARAIMQAHTCNARDAMVTAMRGHGGDTPDAGLRATG